MECYILTFHIADFLINKSHGVIRYGNAVLSKQPTNIFIWKHVTNAVRDFSSFSCQSLTADSEVLNHGGSKSVLWLGCIPTGNEICVNWQQSARATVMVRTVHWLQGNSAQSPGFFLIVNHWRLLPMLPHLCLKMLQKGPEIMSLELCQKKKNYDVQQESKTLTKCLEKPKL